MAYGEPIAGLGTGQGGEGEAGARRTAAGPIMGYAEPVAGLGTLRNGKEEAS